MMLHVSDAASQRLLGEILEQLITLNRTASSLLVGVQKITAILEAPPPVAFSIKITQGDKMAGRLKAGIDVQLLDNGTAQATVTLVDAAGLPTTLPTGSTLSVPAWVVSNPAIVATVAADGLSAALAPSVPPVLATDVTVTVGPATMTNADGTTVTIAAVTSDGIDVISGGPAGFAISV